MGQYGFAYKNFTRAKEQNPFDAITNEYLYYCYWFAGRTADAKNFLCSLSGNGKNIHLTKLTLTEDPELLVNYAYTGYDVKKYQNNPLNYEAIECLTEFKIGLNFNFSPPSTRLSAVFKHP